MRRNLALGVPLVVMTVLAFGCGGGSSSPTEPGTEPARLDSLVLLSVEPAPGAHVRLGQRVPVRARFRYTFKEATGGMINVLVLPVPFDLPILTDSFPPRVVVEGREGEVTLSFDIRMDDADPQCRAILTRFPLFPQGRSIQCRLVDRARAVDRI
jgi:hypothetical protein